MTRSVSPSRRSARRTRRGLIFRGRARDRVRRLPAHRPDRRPGPSRPYGSTSAGSATRFPTTKTINPLADSGPRTRRVACPPAPSGTSKAAENNAIRPPVHARRSACAHFGTRDCETPDRAGETSWPGVYLTVGGLSDDPPKRTYCSCSRRHSLPCGELHRPRTLVLLVFSSGRAMSGCRALSSRLMWGVRTAFLARVSVSASG